MKTILLSLFIFSAAFAQAQKRSLLLDITQASLLSPVLVYNIYTPFTYNNHIAFLQIGIGGQAGFSKEYLRMGYPIDIYEMFDAEPYHDSKVIYSYNGGQFRLGAFTGKLFSDKQSRLHLKKIMYLGVGSVFRYGSCKDMKVPYEFTTQEDYNKSYRYQSEKAVILAPFFNAGVQLFRNRLMAEWYAGIQSIIKFRNKEISKEYIITERPYTVTEKGPYTEKETNILPALTLGFRVGSLLK